MSHVCTVLPIVIVSMNGAVIFTIASYGVEKFYIPLFILFSSVVIGLTMIFKAYAKLRNYIDIIISHENDASIKLNYEYLKLLNSFFKAQNWSLYVSIVFFALGIVSFLYIECDMTICKIVQSFKFYNTAFSY
jgi:hypothetical protein